MLAPGEQLRAALAAALNAMHVPGAELFTAESWEVVMIEIALTQVGLRRLLAVLQAGYGNADFIVDKHKVIMVGGGPTEAIHWSDLRGEPPGRRK